MIVREIITKDGVRVERLVDYKTGNVVSSLPPRERAVDPWTNHVSWAAGVHPDDRETAMKDAAAKGVTTHFDEDGNPHFTSAKHQRRFCRAYGMVNKQSYY